jgi:pilus assembly protein Flp/PilA
MMRQQSRNLLDDQRGVTSLEYAIIALMIGVAIISGVSLLGTNLKPIFSAVATSI